MNYYLKKSLLLSSFTCSFIFPMRQIAQVALANIVSKEQATQVALARMFNQSAHFHNSLTARCPFIASIVLLQLTTQVTDDTSAIMNHQDAAANYMILPHLMESETMHQDIPLYKVRQREPLETNQKFQLSKDMLHNHDVSKIRKHLSEADFRAKIKELEEAYFINTKSKMSFYLNKFETIVQNKACKQADSYYLLSNDEILAEKKALTEKLKKLENKLLSFRQLNANADFVLNPTKFGLNSESMPSHVQDKWTIKDYDVAVRALELKAEIESTKIVIQKCKKIAFRFDQEMYDLVF